ncbi:MAG: isochorismatase family protein [Alphaproteobacteria bacterium]|nr:isochorismatase family protein [Alphaproteobacteria bacterium]
MKLEADRSVLLVVDIQKRLAPSIAGAEGAIDRTKRLIRGAVHLGVPVLATEQAPGSIGGTVSEIEDLLPAPALAKTHFDATLEPEILHALAETGRDMVILAGMEAHVCVLQTALGALGHGYHAHLCADAIGSRDPANRDRALVRFESCGGGVVTSEMVLFEWLGRSDRPEFKPFLELIK